MATLPQFGGIPVPGPSSFATGGPSLAGIQAGIGFRPQPSVLTDVDPITPGAQTTPGVVTATGPTRVVPGGPIGRVTGAVGLPSIANRPGFTGGIGVGAVGGVMDADPITPGIQSRPGVVTQMGPPRVVSGPRTTVGAVGFGGFNSGAFTTSRPFSTGFPGGVPGGMIGAGMPTITQNFPGAVVDADPITPGIQTQPGVVTPTGPPTVISGPNTFGGINTTMTSGIAAGAVTGGFGGTVVDADPITPGIQAEPGVVTPTGPPTIVGNTFAASGGMTSSGFLGAGGYGGGMLTSGVRSGPPVTFQTTITPPPMISSKIMSSGIQQTYNYGGGIVDADPITPGIQAQPGTITATGPSVVVSTGGFGGGFPSGVVDADPITPGIQTSPGTLTQTGPTTVVSRPTLGSIVGGGVIDADPITPGVQSTPGMITQTGPSVVVGNINRRGDMDWCPRWLVPLLGLMLLAGAIAGLYVSFRPRPRRHMKEDDDDEERSVRRSGPE